MIIKESAEPSKTKQKQKTSEDRKLCKKKRGSSVTNGSWGFAVISPFKISITTLLFYVTIYSVGLHYK